jgi:hypothetical protein
MPAIGIGAKGATHRAHIARIVSRIEPNMNGAPITIISRNPMQKKLIVHAIYAGVFVLPNSGAMVISFKFCDNYVKSSFS